MSQTDKLGNLSKPQVQNEKGSNNPEVLTQKAAHYQQKDEQKINDKCKYFCREISSSVAKGDKILEDDKA